LFNPCTFCLGLEWKSIKKLWRKKEMHNLAYELVRLLAMNDNSWQHSSIEIDRTVCLGIQMEKQKEQDVSSHKAFTYIPLLMAACNGIKEIVELIIHFHPQSIEHVSEDQQNILHMAIKHRQLEILQMLNKLKMVRHLAGKIDNESNTVLHNAAYFRGGSQPSYALQLQEELHWFEVSIIYEYDKMSNYICT
jgi:ankyrin repeat protein